MKPVHRGYFLYSISLRKCYSADYLNSLEEDGEQAFFSGYLSENCSHDQCTFFEIPASPPPLYFCFLTCGVVVWCRTNCFHNLKTQMSSAQDCFCKLSWSQLFLCVYMWLHKNLTPNSVLSSENWVASNKLISWVYFLLNASTWCCQVSVECFCINLSHFFNSMHQSKIKIKVKVNQPD